MNDPMEKPSIEKVLENLSTLYNGTNPKETEEASKWLMMIQRSVHAWELADHLLVLKKDLPTSMFAAQTMRAKIQFSFDELPESTHVALRDSLFNHLTTLATADITITRQLALALTDLALQMTSWVGIVNDIIERFKSNIATIPVLLEILKVLPEEIGSRSLRLGANRRLELRRSLGQDCVKVLSLLVVCITNWPDNSDMQFRIFECLGSWLQLGGFPPEDVSNSPLILAPFNALHLLEVSEKLYNAATEAICSALTVCEDTDSYQPLAHILVTEVKKLAPVFEASVVSEDLDRAQCLCRIFTNLAESFLYHVIHQPGTALGDMAIMDMLVQCVKHPDYEVADITFSLWYQLSECLYDNENELWEQFRPHVQELLAALCNHCKLDEKLSPTSVPDDDNDFEDFRNGVVELTRDIVFVVGSLSIFQDLFNHMIRPGLPWNAQEACLHMMYAVAPSIRPDEDEILPATVTSLLTISADAHFSIRAAVLRLLSQLGGWIKEHQDMLGQVLQFLMEGLRIPQVSTYAAHALREMCDKCKKEMTPNFDGLLEIVQAADTLSISKDAVIGLLRGVGEVLKEMPDDQVTDSLRKLCFLQVQHLNQLITSRNEGVPASIDPCLWLDRLAAIFRSCSLPTKEGQTTTHPYMAVIVEIWPTIKSICQLCQNDVVTVERSTRCIRFMLRSVGIAAVPILQEIVEVSMLIYQQWKHSCFLYLGSIIVDEFGLVVSCQPGLVTMVHEYSKTVFSQLSSPAGLVNHPDTVDDFFRLAARCIQHFPMLFIQSEVFAPTVECSLSAATLDHRDSFMSVMKFLKTLLACPYNKEGQVVSTDLQQLIISLLQAKGQALVVALVTGFTLLPVYLCVDSSEVLWLLLSRFREATVGWLDEAIKPLLMGTMVGRNISITAQQKQQFLQDIERCSTQENLYPIVKQFAKLFR